MYEWDEMNLKQLASRVGVPGSLDSQAVQVEMLRRQTEAQIRSAKYMLWSVVAIALTSGVNAAFAVLSWYGPTIHETGTLDIAGMVGQHESP